MTSCATLHQHLLSSLHTAWQLAQRAPDAAWASRFFTAPDPFVACLFVLATCVLVCWLWSLPTGNCSHVDRMWSIVPVVYVALCAREELSALARGRPEDADARLLLQLALVTAWGSRLTYNFARKGATAAWRRQHRPVAKHRCPALV